ncbi:MAG: hypothetical protein IT320_18985 [Anaerolineae bacterium]|nr:hypothetical protein [Anaerolineae bacterium]
MRPLFFFLERLLLVALFVGGVVVIIAFVFQLGNTDDAQTADVTVTEVLTVVPQSAAAPVAAAATDVAPAETPADFPALTDAEDVVSLCHTVPGTAMITVCLRSNGSGTMTVDNGGQTSEYVYAFYTDGQSCPTAPQGLIVANQRMTTHDLADFGFTQADIEALGLPGRYCAFSAAA